MTMLTESSHSVGSSSPAKEGAVGGWKNVASTPTSRSSLLAGLVSRAGTSPSVLVVLVVSAIFLVNMMGGSFRYYNRFPLVNGSYSSNPHDAMTVDLLLAQLLNSNHGGDHDDKIHIDKNADQRERRRPEADDYRKGKEDGKLIVYTFFMPYDNNPDGEDSEERAKKIAGLNYFECPVAAMLQRYGHNELRVMGTNTTYDSATSTFSGNFLDGTMVWNHPVGGNKNTLKKHFFYSALNTTMTRRQDRKRGEEATSSSIKYEPGPEDTILFIDGLDVLFVRDPSPIADAWKSHQGRGPSAYFAGERNCHPFTCQPKGFCVGRGHTYTLANGERVRGEFMCDAMRRQNSGRFSYGNTGFIWGSARGLRTMYDTLPAVLASESNKLDCDQGMLQLLQLKHPELLGMDTEQRWGYMGAGGNFTAEYGIGPEDVMEKELYSDERVRKEWPTSIIDGMKPVALHFNGDSRPHWISVKRYIRKKLQLERDLDNVQTITTEGGFISSSWIDVDNNGERVHCTF